MVWLSAMTPAGKAAEAAAAVKDGADELDMVINVGMIKSGDWEYVCRDIEGVVEAAGSSALVKVILETCLLTEDEKRRACRVCRKAGAAFVKTGTGWAGATTEHHIEVIKAAVGDTIPLKVAGGVRSLDTLLKMRDMGVSRFGIGYKSALGIMREAEERGWL